MEINLFTILILIFLLFPFLRRIFEGLKGGTERPDEMGTGEDAWPQADRGDQPESSARTTRTGAHSREERGEQSWEDFFEGLEKVVAGEEPVQQRSRSAGTEQRPETAAQASGRQAASQSTRSQSRSQRDSAYRHPSHGPISGSGTGSRQGSVSPSSDPFSYDDGSGTEIGRQADQVSRELIEGDNPIYQDLGDTPEVVVTGTRGRKYIKGVLMDSEKLRDGILIKEILDSPKSRRSNQHRF
ncbi:MAG: hypothetical protein EA363_04985 [Balneolaceae bacterium]|nr:MAG: hypothetical protein EA363_04985 [Balneolaceae bacterium]